VTLLLGLSGCGASERQQVVAAIRASDAAWDRGDLDAGCAWLTQRARSAVLRGSPHPGARTCSEAFAVVEEQQATEFGVSEAELVSSEPARMTSVRVDGDTAVVSYSDGAQRRLRKIRGRWLIDSY
jgi:ketosteroid isomerase-like protein